MAGVGLLGIPEARGTFSEPGSAVVSASSGRGRREGLVEPGVVVVGEGLAHHVRHKGRHHPPHRAVPHTQLLVGLA